MSERTLEASISDTTSPADEPGPGRRPVITRADIIAAALNLLGPTRSVSTLSLREVAREAGIAPNSFYRHFRDVDELAVALIDQAGQSLRQIIGAARQRAGSERGVVQGCTDAFMEQLSRWQSEARSGPREGPVGSTAFRRAAERQLRFFKGELRVDLVRLAAEKHSGLHDPALTAKAITRLVFAMGATALDLPEEGRAELNRQIVGMVRMIIAGTQVLAVQAGSRTT